MIRFFLQRPIFAGVCSALILLVGAVVIPILPIAQFPQIAPPVVTVSATWTGASAQALESSVTTPLEEAINGVEGLRYITSTSTSAGVTTITCTFDLGRSLDIAATDVQNAVGTTRSSLRRETIATIDFALGKIPSDQRRAIVLHDIAGYSSREIAQIDGFPHNTVRTRLSRARRAMRRELCALI
jgi:RNA polymerase sigma factor (sigma-70 family)